MYDGFPLDLIARLRCPEDAHSMHLAVTRALQDKVASGALGCPTCGTVYPISDGVVRMIRQSALDKASEHEQKRRDEGATKDDFSWETTAVSQMEVGPVMEAMQPDPRMTVLELGCGKGRFTTILARQSASIIGLDFSFAALKRLAARVQPSWHIGLVQADCTRSAVAAGTSQRVLSTLVSNLPTREHRRAMYRLAADALSPDGKFVFTVHHHNLRHRIRKTPQAGHYPESGIFRYQFRRDEITDECGAFFDKVHCRPIQITLPLLGQAGLQTVAASRIAEKTPLLNQLGELLLAVGEGPRLEQQAVEHDAAIGMPPLPERQRAGN